MFRCYIYLTCCHICDPDNPGIRYLTGTSSMLICVTTVEVWLSQYLSLEDIVANFSPKANARDDDSSNAAGQQKNKCKELVKSANIKPLLL
jgi:hypothetical protein